jgi:hypothetical protein
MNAIVNLSDVPVIERQHARAGLFRSQALMQGEDGSPDNFFLQLSHTFSDFASPRHRHNFDQIRVQLRSDADFARDGVMRPGMLAYFPEGVFYGPQSIAGESSTLVLQFGGASGSGYISEDRFQQGVAELRAHGEFEGGIYRTTQADGRRRNQDAYEAVWEHIHGRRLHYPASTYAQPVFIDPEVAAWRDEPGQPGVRRRALGRFEPRGVVLSMIDLAAGARTALAPYAIGFVMAGRGRAHDRPWQPHASLRTTHAALDLIADEPAQVLEIAIPPLAGA